MNEQQKKARASWEKFLNPLSLRTNLSVCSLFLAAWEMLQTSVIDPLRSFHMDGIDENGIITGEDYKTSVLDRDKSVFRASLLWFREMGAIDDADLALADQIRKHRNEIAHELAKFLTSVDHEVDSELFRELIGLVIKIDRWWILEIEIPTNPEPYRAKEILETEVQSGNMMILQAMLHIALADETAL